MNVLKAILVCCVAFTQLGCVSQKTEPWLWESVNATGEPTARHEAGLVAIDDKIYLLGGRRINPTDVFDTTTNTWAEKSKTPIELHHFQPVVFEGKIYIIGALTGGWPNENPVEQVIIYDPKTDTYSYGHDIPKHRQRGGAGAVVYNNKIYIVGGIVNGHMDGYKSWFDEYDPKTGKWTILQDAPNARDHFQAVIADNKLYTFAGRTTSRRTGDDMNFTVKHGNVYNFEQSTWEQTTANLGIPTKRAGNSAFAWNDHVIIGGGESEVQKVAHNEVEAFNVNTKNWMTWPSLQRGRHGSGFVTVDDYVYIISGSGNRGGGPELKTIERLKLPALNDKKQLLSTNVIAKKTPVYSQWHTITLPFEGPTTSETDANNPFLNYRLTVEFIHQDVSYKIRGFYAADGDSAHSSASSGNVWQVRFTPELQGRWSYKATLSTGHNIALSDDSTLGKTIPLVNNKGTFNVTRTDKHGNDFRASGRLGVTDTFYKFQDTPQIQNKFWVKGGTNSPENLLGYVGFDGTYRIKAAARKGEAEAADELHKFLPHLQDWKTGDPTWKNGQGKSLIGAVNYLAGMGMNSAYFLTLNILGDGKDVWPYHSPDDFSRFDVSKLDQWEIVFQHMQAKGILLHVVTQETENERMLDDGDTGPMRQLYFRELIARFGHHLGLIWNLGEENGPASFSPHAQNDKQRKAMTRFLKKVDPYKHPVLLHTHSHDPARGEILDQIVGFKALDGLSLQADKREGVPKVIRELKALSKAAGKEWLISMDEIGKWDVAAQTDKLDPTHYSLQRYALWGSLMAGSAGVEWYFGAKIPHNDLTSEDWRQRHNLWAITRHATSFYQHHLPFWEMTPCQELLINTQGYCSAKLNNVYSAYIVGGSSNQLNLSHAIGQFSVKWYSPRTGRFVDGSINTLSGGAIVNLGYPSEDKSEDWVVLITK
jgi:hypothetical protein